MDTKALKQMISIYSACKVQSVTCMNTLVVRLNCCLLLCSQNPLEDTNTQCHAHIIFTNTHTHTPWHTHTYMYTHTHTPTHTHACTRIHTHRHALHTHTHTHTHTLIIPPQYHSYNNMYMDVYTTINSNSITIATHTSPPLTFHSTTRSYTSSTSYSPHSHTEHTLVVQLQAFPACRGYHSPPIAWLQLGAPLKLARGVAWLVALQWRPILMSCL